MLRPSSVLDSVKRWAYHGEWEGSSLGLRWVSLRFSDTQQESDFVRSRSRKLRATAWSLASLLLLITGLLVGTHLADTSQMQRLGSTATYIRNLQLVSFGIIGLLAVLVMVTTVIPETCKDFSVSCQEVVIIFLIAACMCVNMTMTGSLWTTTKIVAGSPSTVWGETCFCQTTTILIVDLYITVSHVVLPMRWQFLSILAVISLVVYAALSIAYGTQEPSLSSHIMLCGLIFASSLGKRNQEINERRLFAELTKHAVSLGEADLGESQERDHGNPNILWGGFSSGLHHGSVDSPNIIGQSSLGLDATLRVGQKEHWLISTEDLLLLPQNVLGGGAFGITVVGLFHGAKVAVKLSRNPLHASQQQEMQHMAQELTILKRCRHPNLVELHGAILDPPEYCIAVALELVDGLNLDDVMSQSGSSVDETARYDMIVCISRALRFLHVQKPAVVHGAVKSTNVLVERKKHAMFAKVTDVGLNRVPVNSGKHVNGSLGWMAPELTRKFTPSIKSDVFSAGRLIYFIATGLKPMNGRERHSIKRILRSGNLPALVWPRASSIEDHCKSCVEECSSPMPEARPSMDVVYSQIEAWPIDSVLLMEECANTWSQGLKELQKVVSKRKYELQTKRYFSEQSSPSNVPGLAVIHETNPKSEAVPGYKPTPYETQLQLLALTIRRSNCIVGEACCAFHGSLRSCARACEDLMKAECDKEFFDDVEGQCLECGALAMEITPEGICDICNGPVTPVQSQKSSSSAEAEETSSQPPPPIVSL